MRSHGQRIHRRTLFAIALVGIMLSGEAMTSMRGRGPVVVSIAMLRLSSLHKP